MLDEARDTSWRFKSRLLHGLVLVHLAACTPGSMRVARVVRGEELPGRFISDQAYASYARAAYLEAHGDLRGAADVYRQAADEDDESAEIWTRLGALRCQLGDASFEQAFDRAAVLDSEYEPMRRARARCFLRRGALKAALAEAETALMLDPNQEETSVLLVTIHERLEQLGHAQRFLDALVARRPNSSTALNALLGFAIRTGDQVRRERAESALGRLRPEAPEPAQYVAAFDGWQAVDAALLRGELLEARSIAVKNHMPGGVLAARAALLGRAELALLQAAHVLGADDSDADAWVAALVASDLKRDSSHFHRMLHAFDPQAFELDPLSVRLLADLLDRRVGSAAKAAWLEAFGSLPAARGAAEQALDLRLRKPE